MRYVSRLALRSPVKAHLAAPEAEAAQPPSPERRSLCLYVSASARRTLASRDTASRCAPGARRPPELPGVTDSRSADQVPSKPRRVETDCTRASAREMQRSEARVSVMGRNLASEMWFPARRAGGDARQFRWATSAKPMQERMASVKLARRRSASEQILGDRHQLHVRRALVDLADLRVAIQLFDWIFLDEPIAAVEVDRHRRDPLGDFG